MKITCYPWIESISLPDFHPPCPRPRKPSAHGKHKKRKHTGEKCDLNESRTKLQHNENPQKQNDGQGKLQHKRTANM